MLTLRRSIRLQDQLLLPNGDRLFVHLDVEAQLPALIRAQNDVILAARASAGDSADETGRKAGFSGMTHASDPFFEAYRALLQITLGQDGLNRALAAYDGELRELCTQLDGWIGAELAPRIRSASARRFRWRKAQSRRMLRRAR